MSTTTSSTPVPVVIGATTASPATSTVAVSTASITISIGLSSTQVCADGASVVGIIADLISQRFALDPTNVGALKAEMITYFYKAGVTNKQIFSFITGFKFGLM